MGSAKDKSLAEIVNDSIVTGPVEIVLRCCFCCCCFETGKVELQVFYGNLTHYQGMITRREMLVGQRTIELCLCH